MTIQSRTQQLSAYIAFRNAVVRGSFKALSGTLLVLLP